MKQKIIEVLVIIFIFVLSCAWFMGCKSFDPNEYIVQGQPAECNDYYITIGVYYKNGGKDFAFPATIYEACKQARGREQKIADLCGRLYEGDPKGFRECVK